mmetsp:Transcript_10985/g.26074  ORF Transcript_10985/g.26074 Transcript_10985/m.26074 type:complete len:247 (+) Transcript_10985:95-835(+)
MNERGGSVAAEWHGAGTASGANRSSGHREVCPHQRCPRLPLSTVPACWACLKAEGAEGCGALRVCRSDVEGHAHASLPREIGVGLPERLIRSRRREGIEVLRLPEPRHEGVGSSDLRADFYSTRHSLHTACKQKEETYQAKKPRAGREQQRGSSLTWPKTLCHLLQLGQHLWSVLLGVFGVPWILRDEKKMLEAFTPAIALPIDVFKRAWNFCLPHKLVEALALLRSPLRHFRHRRMSPKLVGRSL